MVKDLVIAGASLASLKIASLLAATQFLSYRITIIAPNDEFLFFPLLPDLISGGIRQTLCFSTLADFCRIRNIRYVHDIVEDINIENHFLVTASHHSFRYDYLLACTGISPDGICEQTRWRCIYRDILSSGSEAVLLPCPGIAEFEVIAATRVLTPKRYFTIDKKTDTRNFHTHPSLGSIEHIACQRIYADKVSNIKIDRGIRSADRRLLTVDSGLSRILTTYGYAELIRYNVIPLGGAECIVSRTQSSAQYASYTAKVAYIFLLGRLTGWHDWGQGSLACSYKKFRSRGVMLFMSKNRAAIWLNDARPQPRPPDISGLSASMIRRAFYLYQMILFYSGLRANWPLLYLYIAQLIAWWQLDIVCRACARLGRSFADRFVYLLNR